MSRVKIKSLEHLKEILINSDKDSDEDFVLFLNSGLRSSKYIGYDDGIFCITNCIDDSEQELNDKEIMDDEYTNIGKGIKLGAFYWEPEE